MLICLRYDVRWALKLVLPLWANYLFIYSLSYTLTQYLLTNIGLLESFTQIVRFFRVIEVQAFSDQLKPFG